jgi:Cof subfamily protein (haloacid dehalogenase superfamily)
MKPLYKKEKYMYKMIVTDLDDTLLKTDKSISQYTIDVLKDIRKRGKKVIFATARGDSVEFLKPHDLFDGCVLTNGAIAYIGNRIVYESLIDADTYLPFLQKIYDLNFKVGVQANGTHYTNFDASEKWENFNNYTITNFSNISARAEKIYIVINDPKQQEIIKSILPQGLYLSVSRDNLAMVMNQGATKSRGIAAIADKFGISKEEIVVFGDDTNDIEMLKDFGLGVAMSNSIDEVKDIADYVCDSNDNDGVAKWLDEKIGRKHLD